MTLFYKAVALFAIIFLYSSKPSNANSRGDLNDPKVVHDITTLLDHSLEDRSVLPLLKTIFRNQDAIGVHYEIGNKQSENLLKALNDINQIMPTSKKKRIFLSIRNFTHFDLTTITSKLAHVEGIILGSFEGDECSKKSPLDDDLELGSGILYDGSGNSLLDELENSGRAPSKDQKCTESSPIEDDECFEFNANTSPLHESRIQEFKKLLNPLQVKIGFGYHMDKFCAQLLPLIEAADFTVVKVDFITQLKFPESYGLFRTHLESISKKKSPILYHLKLASISEKTPPPTDLDYNILLEQFTKRWTGETGSSVIIQYSNYSYFPKLGSNVTSIEKEVKGRSRAVIPNFHTKESLSTLTKSLPHALNMVSSAFETIHVSHGVWEYMSILWNISGSSSPSMSTKLLQPLNAIVEMNSRILNFPQLSKQITNTLALRRKFKEENIHMTSIDFYTNDNYRDLIEKNGEANHLLENTTSGCLFIVNNIDEIPSPDNLVELTRKNCRFIFDHGIQSHEFTWYLNLNIQEVDKHNFSFDFYTNHVQANLNKVLAGREAFLKMDPEAHLSLKIHSEYDKWLNKLEENGTTRNFYCSEKLLKVNEYFEAIGNWARIHNFPVIIKDLFASDSPHTEHGWLWQIQPGQGISEQVKENPYFVMRNHPEKVINWKVDPCVEWSYQAPMSSIILDKDFSGISVSMGVRNSTLNIRELETMLMFAFDQFKTVELLPRNNQHQLEDFQLLNSVLTTDFLEDLVFFNILSGRLSIEVSLDGNDFPEILKEVGEIASKIDQGPTSGLQLAGVHLSNWERSSSQEIVKDVVMLGEKYNFKVGLAVQNCSELLNRLAINYNQIYLPTTNYIICSTQNFPAHNDDKLDMATNLDTHLYMRAIFQKFLPKLSVFYRLNSFPCCDHDSKEEQTRKLFRFLNDVNQFAVGNSLKYFLIQAFTISSGSFSSSSWFRMETYTDFSNSSGIFKREDDINPKGQLNQSKFIRSCPSCKITLSENPKIANDKDKDTGWTIWLFVSLACGVVVVGILVTIIFLLKRNRKWVWSTTSTKSENVVST